MAVVCAMKEAVGSTRGVWGLSFNLKNRQASEHDTSVSPKAGVHVNQFYVLHIWSFSTHH